MVGAAHGTCGLYHVDPTHAVHGAVVQYLFDLILDLDHARVTGGQPRPERAITRERLARWPAVSDELRSCWEARFLKGGHDEELAYGDALTASLSAALDAGRVPQFDPGTFPHFERARRLIERCREDTKKY